MSSFFRSLILVSVVFFVTKSTDLRLLGDEITEQCQKHIFSKYGSELFQGFIPDDGRVVTSSYRGSPAEKYGGQREYSMIGSDKRGVVIERFQNTESRTIYNERYGFRVERRNNERWQLLEMNGRNEIINKLVSLAPCSSEDFLGHTNLHRIIKDPSFRISSMKAMRRFASTMRGEIRPGVSALMSLNVSLR